MFEDVVSFSFFFLTVILKKKGEEGKENAGFWNSFHRCLSRVDTREIKKPRRTLKILDRVTGRSHRVSRLLALFNLTTSPRTKDFHRIFNHIVITTLSSIKFLSS